MMCAIVSILCGKIAYFLKIDSNTLNQQTNETESNLYPTAIAKSRLEEFKQLFMMGYEINKIHVHLKE